MTTDLQDFSETSDQNPSTLRRYLNSNRTLVTAIGAVVIIVATLIAYIPAIRGGFVWDDDEYVTNNSFLSNWGDLQRIWFGIVHPSEYGLPQYYPMTHTSFWLEYRLWGLNPMGYHIDNVLLHIIDALLLWLLLHKLRVPGAWLAAVIFALHPLHVESVAWISERKNVLSLMFFLSSLYMYLRYVGIIQGEPVVAKAVGSGENEEQQDIVWFKLPEDPVRLYTLSAVLFLFALFTKTVTFSLPAVALLIIFWKRGGRIDLKKDLLPLLPFAAVGIAMASLTSYMEFHIVGVAIRPKPWHYADTPLGQFGAKSIIAGKALWFYVWKLLVPTNLMFNYPRWKIDPSNAAQYLYPITALLALAAVLIARKKIGGWGTVVAVLFFVGTLFPALGFFDVWPMQFAFVADHFAYLSSIGLIALIAALLVRYLPLELVGAIALVVIGTFGFLTFNQSKQYKDVPTLWHTTWIKSNRTSWMAANNYGSYILQQNIRDIVPAEAWFKQALLLKPDYSEARLNLAKIAVARGIAIEDLRRRAATQFSTTAPSALPTTMTAADFNAEAIRLVREALRDEPEFYPGHYFLGTMLLNSGQVEEAKKEFQATVDIYPRYYQAYIALGNLALKENNLDAAIASFHHAATVEIESAEAHALLGTTLLQRGGPDDAKWGLEEWDNAMKMDPTNYRYPLQFAVLLASNGKFPAAGQLFKDAAMLNPQSAEVYTAWGIAAARAGFPKEAKDLFNRALQAEPNYTAAKEKLEALNNGQLQPTTTRASTGPTTSVAPAAS